MGFSERRLASRGGLLGVCPASHPAPALCLLGGQRGPTGVPAWGVAGLSHQCHWCRLQRCCPRSLHAPPPCGWASAVCVSTRTHRRKVLLTPLPLRRWVRQQSELAKQAQNPNQGPKLDLGFKEGQTITLNIAVRHCPGCGGGGKGSTAQPAAEGGGASGAREAAMQKSPFSGASLDRELWLFCRPLAGGFCVLPFPPSLWVDLPPLPEQGRPRDVGRRGLFPASTAGL